AKRNGVMTRMAAGPNRKAKASLGNSRNGLWGVNASLWKGGFQTTTHARRLIATNKYAPPTSSRSYRSVSLPLGNASTRWTNTTLPKPIKIWLIGQVSDVGKTHRTPSAPTI